MGGQGAFRGLVGFGTVWYGLGVNLLLQTKSEVETHFGKKGTFAENLLGMTSQGEKAYGFLTGDMTNGYEVCIGFFNDKARYVSFQRRAGGKWSEADLRSVLVQIGPMANWTSKPGSDFFDYAEDQGKKPPALATGWQTPAAKYAFIYVPSETGDVGLMPDKLALDRKMGGGRSVARSRKTGSTSRTRAARR